MRSFTTETDTSSLEPSEFRVINEVRERRSRRWLWTCLILLAAGVSGIYWFAIRDQNVRLAELPSLRSALGQAGEQITQLQAKIRSWDEQDFDGRLGKLETRIETGLQSVSRQARNAADAASARLRAEFVSMANAMDNRIAHLESQHETDRAQLASLEGELSRLKQEVALHEARLEGADRNASMDKAVLEQQIVAAREEARDGRRDLETLAQGLKSQRVDFEVSKGHSQRLAEGISISVTGIDVAKRRVNGWMWIMPDRKTIWMRDQGAMQPVIFYSAADGKRREVVFTHVTSNGAVGYLLLPNEKVRSPLAMTFQGRGEAIAPVAR